MITASSLSAFKFSHSYNDQSKHHCLHVFRVRTLPVSCCRFCSRRSSTRASTRSLPAKRTSRNPGAIYRKCGAHTETSTSIHEHTHGLRLSAAVIVLIEV